MRIHGYHLRRSGDPDAAYDLTAETFAQAWLSRGRFRDEAGGTVGPWLFGIARNVLAASMRRRRIERAACERLGLLDDRANATEPEPDPSWLVGLDQALDALPEGQHDAVRLRVVDELGYEEIAASLGTTPAAARVRVHRGLAALRSRLEGTP